MKTIEFSVVIPSYNQGEYLEETIQSIISQDYKNFKIYIFDGGSTDNSVEIIKKYEKYITYWHSKKDNGQSDAINQGLKMVQGDVIAWINSDDTYLPGAFSNVSKYFSDNDDCEILYGNFHYTDHDGNLLREVKVPKKVSYNKMLFHNYLGQPAVFFTKRGVDNIGLLTEEYHYVMDWEYWLRWLTKYNFHYCNHFLATYRLQADAKTSQQGDRKFGSEINLMLKRRRLKIFKLNILNVLLYKFYYLFSKFQRIKEIFSYDVSGYFKIYRYLHSNNSFIHYIKWRLFH